MAEYLSPGVYVEEYDNSPRAMEGVGTSTAGFVGLAEMGPTAGAPSLVTGFNEFTKQFGGFLSEFTHGEYRYLANSVEQFFLNGGTRCFVSRVIPEDAKLAKGEAGILTVEAANEGKWGNKLRITMEQAKRKKLQLIRKEEDGYLFKSVEGLREGDLIAAGETYHKILSINENIIQFAPELTAEKDLQPVGMYLFELDVQVQYQEQVEKYAGLSFNLTSARFIGTQMEESGLVKISLGEIPETGNPLAAIFGEEKTGGTCSLTGGTDGGMEKVTAGTFIGADKGPGQRTGIQSFIENNVVSMMAVPGITMPEVVTALVAHCENTKSRFAVLDMPKEMANTKELAEYREMVDSTYAAMYHPWISAFDRAANKTGIIPPSGAILGIYSKTDIERGVHKAPANVTVACTGLAINFGQGEQDILNPLGINLIRAIPGQGIRVWGARTASSNSAFKYVNIRRLFIFVEESIKANTNWVVFEPNDATLWNRVSLTLSGFLGTLWRNGMFAGSSQGEAYFVDIGPNTMTKDDIKNGRLICNIGIAPSRPAEFIIFRVTQHTAEAGE